MKSLKLLATIASVFALLAVGCGGGGGGGGGSPAESGLTYVGVKTQAEITDSNTQDLTTGSYEGGTVGASMSAFGAVTSQTGTGMGIPRGLEVSRVADSVIGKLDLTSRAGGLYVGAVYNEKDTISGDCGGSASYDINVNDQTGIFSGTFNFSKYCTELSGQRVTISGRCTFSGEIDVQTDEILVFDFSYDNVAVTSGADSYSADGTVSFDNTVSPAEINIDLLLEHKGEVFWVNNYTITFTEGWDYIDFRLTGSCRYYDPQYGYVAVRTTTPFRVYDFDEWPSQGVLIITGSVGNGGNNTLGRLTAIDSSLCRIEADTNGDGFYDWTIEILWSEL